MEVLINYSISDEHGDSDRDYHTEPAYVNVALTTMRDYVYYDFYSALISSGKIWKCIFMMARTS